MQKITYKVYSLLGDYYMGEFDCKKKLEVFLKDIRSKYLDCYEIHICENIKQIPADKVLDLLTLEQPLV